MTRRIIIDEGAETLNYDLLDGETVIGRDECCELPVQGENISRRHLKITSIDGELIAEDLGSSNGTQINGQMLEGKTVLSSGDVILLGEVLLYVDRMPIRSSGLASASARRSRPAHKKSNAGLFAILGVAALAIVGFVMLGGGKDKKAQPQRAEIEEGSQDAQTPSRNSLSSERSEDRSQQRSELTKRRFQSLELTVEECVLQEDFSAAEDAIRKFERQFGRKHSVDLRMSVRRASADAFAAIEKEVEGLGNKGTPEAVALLSNQMSNFAKEDISFRKLRRLLDRKRNQMNAVNAPVVSSFGGEKSENKTHRAETSKKPLLAPAKRELAARAARAAKASGDLAFRERRYRDAEENYKRASENAAGAGLADLDEFNRRLRIATRHARLLDATLAQIAKDPTPFRQIACMPGRKGKVLKADANTIAFDIGDGEEPLELKWKLIRAEAMVGLIRAASFSGQARNDACAALFEFEETELAHLFLHEEAESSDPNTASDIHLVLADALGISVPRGGFQWFDGQYRTPRDVARLETRRKIATNVARIQSEVKEDRLDAYAALMAIGKPGQAAFHRGLIEAKRSYIESLSQFPEYSQLRSLGERLQEMHSARESAFELILDTKLYPYPYRGLGPDVTALYNETQAEIDRRIAVVREIWKDKSTVSIGLGIREASSRLNELNDQLGQLGMGMGLKNPDFVLYLPQDSKVTIRTHALGIEERKRIDESARYMALNANKPTKAKNGEKRQVKITNEYRLMMGRHAVRIHDKLVACARMHCKDMSRLGFFSHFNEKERDKRTPSDRAAICNFFGQGMSENIAKGGGAQSVHTRWCHSSGHHRNILGASWRLLGVGNDGSNWCQNFSIRELSSSTGSEDD